MDTLKSKALLLAAGAIGIYALWPKQTAAGPNINCPGEPGCPGYPAGGGGGASQQAVNNSVGAGTLGPSGQGNCSAGMTMWTHYDDGSGTFYTTCEPYGG